MVVVSFSFTAESPKASLASKPDSVTEEPFAGVEDVEMMVGEVSFVSGSLATRSPTADA